MAKTVTTTSPVKVITSGAVPTTTNLKKGEWAYGIIAGKNRYFGNPTGTAVVEFTANKAVNSVTYNAGTAVLTIAYTDGSASTTITLPKENFLSNAAFNPSTNILTLTLTDNTTVGVDLSELIDVYTAAAAGGLSVSGNAFGIAAKGVVETMLADAITTKLNKSLSITNGTAEAGKYVSAVSVSDHAVTITKASLSDATLTAAASQPISVGGKLGAATTTINAGAVTSGGGLKVVSNALELDTDSISVSLTVVEI